MTNFSKLKISHRKGDHCKENTTTLTVLPDISIKITATIFVSFVKSKYLILICYLVCLFSPLHLRRSETIRGVSDLQI